MSPLPDRRERRHIDAARNEADQIEAATESPRARAGSAVDPALLASIADYEIVREVERGGQGVVYQARHRATGRKVALKVMREGPLADERDRVRFQREMQVLAQLDHPRIVKILDSGTAPGLSYYAMDYVSGQPLDVALASGARSIRNKLELLVAVCDAVNSAHLRGVIHRDLKPSNICVDANDEPHILDFGLAKVNGRCDARPPNALTVTGQFVGSLPWASPEQAAGAPDKIDVRTDVYSLGVLTYQQLTGTFPYEVTGNLRDVLDHIMTTEPRSPRSLRREIDDELATIMLKSLAKDRDRRYQTAGELARDLRRYLAGEPIEAKRDHAWYTLKKIVLRYKLSAAAAALFVLAGIGFGAAMTALYQSARAAQEESHRATSAALEQARQADQTATFLTSLVENGSANVEWRQAAAIGQQLAALPPSTGFDLLHQCWQSIRSVTARQQLLKAFWFARHPHTLQALHLGVTDPSPLVQAWAFDYLEDIALRSFADDYLDYIAWFARHGQRPLADVLSEHHRAKVDEMIRAQPEHRRDYTHTLLAIATTVRRDPVLQQQLLSAGLAEMLVRWLETNDRTLADAVQTALLALRPGEMLQQELLQPLLARDRDVRARTVSITLLGDLRATWAVPALVAVTQESEPDVVSCAARALAKIGDDACFEPLKAGLHTATLTTHDLTHCRVFADALARLGDARAIPELIALFEAAPEPIGKALEELTSVRGPAGRDAAEHDSHWWRAWWDRNRARFDTARDASRNPEMEAANPVPLESSLSDLARAVASGDLGAVFTSAARIGERHDARAIPALIGLIESDRSYATVYGIGYFALERLTGVPYDASHDGRWWESWWDQNQTGFALTDRK